jgi:hypothetical protein
LRAPGRGNPVVVIDPEEPTTEDTADEYAPAFDIDLEPEQQGTAEVADEPTS